MNWFVLGYLLVGALFAGAVLGTLGDAPGDELYRRHWGALMLLVAFSVIGWPVYLAVAFARGDR